VWSTQGEGFGQQESAWCAGLALPVIVAAFGSLAQAAGVNHVEIVTRNGSNGFELELADTNGEQGADRAGSEQGDDLRLPQ
jgi:hypothetical protein